MLERVLQSGISFASINYRLTGEVPYPAQMHDCARAIQYIRRNAKRWNIDPKRLAAYGGSAGSGISQWLAFHDDMAKPKSKDPVERESTRLSCAIPFNAQCTYDPRQIKKIVPGRAYDNVALKLLYGLPEDWNWDEDEVDEKLDALLKDASPINHLTKDDPPVFVYHFARSNKPGNIHHSNFGKHLKNRMDKLGIECVHRMDTDYTSPQTESVEEMIQFLKRHFRMQ
jgi:acetyl esterase/lipase